MTVMRAKVAVILPCFNAGQYLQETMASVLSQDIGDFRVIAVDDGSTDNTPELLSAYAGPITVLRHKDGRNHGQAAALNLALSQADSEYIAFMDSDDVWHPAKLRKQAEILDRDEDVGLVYTNGYVIDGDGNRLYSLFGGGHVETDAIGAILLNCYIRTPSLVMVRSRLLQTVGPFTVGIIPDQDMWVRLKEVSSFYFLNEMLAYYREHQQQLSTVQQKKMWEDALWTLESALQRYPYPAGVRSKRLAVIHYRLGTSNMQNQAYLEALMHFVKSCWYDPLRAFQQIAGRG